MSSTFNLPGAPECAEDFGVDPATFAGFLIFMVAMLPTGCTRKYLLVDGYDDLKEIMHNGTTLVCVRSYKTRLWVLKFLFEALRIGQVDTIKVLLKNGGGVNQVKQKTGYTAVLLAAENGQVDTIKLLLENGGDTNQADNEGRTALCIASYRGHTAAIKLLLENGGNANQADNSGTTPLLIASQDGQTVAIKLLLKHGADVHKPNGKGVLPLWIATCQGHVETVHVLLKAGADARSTWNEQSVLQIALKYKHRDVVRLLVERWPLDQRAWNMFLMAGGAASELQDYLAPPAHRTTRNHVPRLYSKPDMVKEIWTYLYKPVYVDSD